MQSREKARNTLTPNKSTIWNRIKTIFSKKKPSNPLNKKDKDNTQSAPDSDTNKNQAEIDEAETKRLSEIIKKYQHPPIPYTYDLVPYNPNPLTYIRSDGSQVWCESLASVEPPNNKARNTLTSNNSTMWNRTKTKFIKQTPSNIHEDYNHGR